jgi:Ribbon-helix-helix protein, copG family
VRTTVTIDPDLDAKLRALARERGVSFKEALNGALRLGLSAGQRGSPRPYRVVSKRMGLRPGIDLDRALRLAAELEDEETVRKLELRK